MAPSSPPPGTADPSPTTTSSDSAAVSHPDDAAHHDIIPLSVLELAIVTKGATSGDALREATELAQRADQLGYKRFWVAEHHNMETVASTSPPVLMAHLAALTQQIRLGSGGLMLPNHAPLIAAEQFALLEALYPDRIDLGIGRAPGTDQATAAALRRSVAGLDEDFPRHLIDVMGLLGDERTEEGLFKHFRATPRLETTPEIWLLGSSGFSARLAGILGLPFSFANHFDMGGTEQAAQIYQDAFTPSVVLDEPHLMISASVVIGDDDEHARLLAAPNVLRRFALRTGQRMEVLSPEECVAHPSYAIASQMPSNTIVGTADHAVEALHRLAAITHADELMLFPVAYALSDRVRTIEAIAQQWF